MDDDRDRGGERTRRSGADGMRDRRRFLATIGAVGAAGLAGCFGGDDGDGAGDAGAGGGTPTGPGVEAETDAGDSLFGTDARPATSTQTDTATDETDDARPTATDTDPGPTDGPASPEPTEDPTPNPANPHLPADVEDFALPSGRAATEFDVELHEDTTLIEGAAMEAVVDADLDAHRYVIDESQLDTRVAEGSVLLLSGVALRRVTNVSRSGTEATVDTEFAPLTDAIANGTVAWDAQLPADADHVPPADNRNRTGGNGSSSVTAPSPATRSVETPDSERFDDSDYSDEAIQFAGVGLDHPDGTREHVPLADVTETAVGFEWTYTEGSREYTFSLDWQTVERMQVRVQVAAPAGSEANMALIAEGTVGTARSLAEADVEDEELNRLAVEQEGLAVDTTLEITAAAAGKHTIEWTVPTPFFKFVVTAGPVPITFEIKAKLIGNAKVTGEASATASSEFQYRGRSGLTYEGTDVNAEASMQTENLNPDAADSAANIGNAVDLQFGVAFPRFQISVFDSLLIPYIHTGTTIGSRLTWGPLCKSSYVRFVVQTGYDFEVFGVTLASEQVDLYEDEERAYGDSCETQGSQSRIGRLAGDDALPSLGTHEHFQQ